MCLEIRLDADHPYSNRKRKQREAKMGRENRRDKEAALDADWRVSPYPAMLTLIRRGVITRDVRGDSMLLDQNIVREAMR